ncbi:NADH-quinone oxidoreductase subunit NuoE [Hydrogenimonas urashimensis]|uniref:NADH-quinone oxidoreductase subunit NuoE n=1 Tax=Hydrogenimonas urashimensis TaxID=2740515 RepID=UPI0019161B98|nr:NADH-quinone oxidoreductase subunit NuoE [Hydrogenimonas urashimensis]
MSFQWKKESLEALDALAERYPSKEALMLPALWKVMEQEGVISMDAIDAVAEYLGVPPMKVYGVATFYTMFHLEPVGTYHIQLCKTLSCALCGKGEILEHLKERLGIDVGETTTDGRFTLSQVECLGSCGTAPVMQINDTLYENLTPMKVDEILEGLE